MHVFTLKNQDRYKLTVQLEPWAEVFYLRKGEELQLRQPASLQGSYHLAVYADGDVQIFPMGEFDYPQVFIDNVETEPWNDFV
ncbi:hypothetical protein [Hymenobacter negativus]|uniref:Uncharacterized protein n=1 Tax=Hymenobacter negativus TaxID=2795026 RepID=A0ABS3QI64_9BACT|nr:hypothetical protein [Hymenobacter negativus]MBO2010420.1 hypothetical protein [Hymenobacter negativus]